MEETPAADTHDQIRADGMDAFTSIRVWLFDASTERVKDRKTKLRLERTTTAFRGQMRDLLRAALSTQLEEPTLLGDHVVLYRNVGVGVRVYREVGVYKYVCVYTRIESHIGCEGGVVCVPSCRHPDTSPQVIFFSGSLQSVRMLQETGF